VSCAQSQGLERHHASAPSMNQEWYVLCSVVSHLIVVQGSVGG